MNTISQQEAKELVLLIDKHSTWNHHSTKEMYRIITLLDKLAQFAQAPPFKFVPVQTPVIAKKEPARVSNRSPVRR